MLSPHLRGHLTPSDCRVSRRARSGLQQKASGGSTSAVRRLALEPKAPRGGRHVCERSAGSITTSPPRSGMSAVPCRRVRSRRALAGRSSKRSTMCARISFSSSRASEAPRHRRSPPPNGSHVRGSGWRPRNRSGRNASGAGRACRWINEGGIRISVPASRSALPSRAAPPVLERYRPAAGAAAEPPR